jgi:hypothetical protein
MPNPHAQRPPIQRRTVSKFTVMFAAFLLSLVAGCGGMSSSPASDFRSAEAPAEEAFVGETMAEADNAGAVSPAMDTRRIIATAFMEVVVANTEAAAAEISSLAEDAGGYVSQANMYRDTYGERNLLRGTLTLRVPAEQLEPFLAQLESMAVEVRSMNLEREDVTDQYSDIEAQLRNLRATENELRELLAEVRVRPNATSEDILAVHRDLTEVRSEIEQLQGRQNLLDDRIALSTVNVTLIPDEANRPVVEEGWQPGAVMRNAARALVNALQLLGDLAIWVVVFLLPILLMALIPLVLIVWLIRTIVVRRRRISGQDGVDEEA